MAPFITKLGAPGGTLAGFGFGRKSKPVSYSVLENTTSVNEGGSVTFTINTTSVSNSTILYYTISSVSGTVNSSDFSSPFSGSFTVNNNTGSVTLTLSNDTTTEGTEQFVFQVRTESISGQVVAQSSIITINDTSIAPAYIGTYLFKNSRQYNQPASNWTVPTETSFIWVRTSGSGGQGENIPNDYQGGNGGAGGFTEGVVSVTAGETLKVAVGTLTNNGGGPDSYAPGGGFSGILRGPTTPGAPAPTFTSYLIAGGGGGGQVNTNYPQYPGPGHAGAGGGLTGGSGSLHPNPQPVAPATGGTQFGGGSGSKSYGVSPVPSNGSYLQGGSGQTGGGGGGYYGGGGDGIQFQGGGAGGSGYSGGSYSNGATYGGSGRIVSPAMFQPDYPLLGPNPISPEPWGYGGSGGNGPYPGADNGRGNGFVIVHCFRRAPSLSDFPGVFNVIATY